MPDATWERISEQDGVSTHRMRVAGGWLYRVTTGDPGGTALAFAPTGPAVGGGAPGGADRETEDVPRSDD